VSLAVPAHLHIPFHLTGVVTINYALPPGYSLPFSITFEATSAARSRWAARTSAGAA